MSDEYKPGMPITNEVRVTTMAKLEQAQEVFADQLYVLKVLDGHRIVDTGNLGYYRSDVHCSCAAEWWAGDHEGDPSYEVMWNIHRAEVIAGALAEHDAEVRAEALRDSFTGKTNPYRAGVTP